MTQSVLVILASNAAQALGAIVLAVLLGAFHRQYHRAYLLTWAWSWWAGCVSLLGVSAALLLAPAQPAAAAARVAATLAFLVGGYWQVAWLLFGTYEVVKEKLLPPWLRRSVLGLLLVFAVGCVAASQFLAPGPRYLSRVGVRSLLLGVAFAIAGLAVWRSRSRPMGFGRRLVASTFLLYALHQFHYLTILLIHSFHRGVRDYSAYLLPFDFLFQGLIGIGMVIWLLEYERLRMVAAAERIEHLAYHDALTDLPNRHLLLRYLQQGIARAEARRERLAVLFLDLDRFKVVNDSLGNRYGDELLKAFSERLRGHLRGTDLIARVAADEFAIAVPAVETDAVIPRVAEKLLEITRLPFALQGREVYLTASIGISRCPEDGADAESLLKRAELAMVHAKETHRDTYQIYTPGMDSNTLEQLSLEADLRKALTGGRSELALFYQPVVDSRRRCINGVEALLRWHHPQRGLMIPGDFLWLAEVSGLAGVLDLWVLRTACREIQDWRAQGAPDLQLSVNLSPRSFQQPDLLGSVRKVLAETGLPPSSLVLEITETLAMQNAEATLAVLRDLKDLGVKIAIDDFGTGYSSLSYLTTFPIDLLKVDRSFVHTLGKGRGGEEVAAAVIALAVSLEIGVVAEGVESHEQRRWLQGLGCDLFQGFLFSPPLPAAGCRALVVSEDREEPPWAEALSSA